MIPPVPGPSRVSLYPLFQCSCYAVGTKGPQVHDVGQAVTPPPTLKSRSTTKLREDGLQQSG